MANRKKRKHPPPEPRQPCKCTGCVWGRWEGSKQFCSKPLDFCVRKVKSS